MFKSYHWTGVAGAAVLSVMFWINKMLVDLGQAADGARARYPDNKPVADALNALVGDQAAWTWLATLGLSILFVALIGVALVRRPAGAIIDNRNRISLSKFQAAAWSVLILSTLITAAAARLGAGDAAPLDVAIPSELLAAMGISAASLVAAPALVSRKADAPPPPPEVVAQAEAATNTPPGAGAAHGRIFARQTPACANWLDMFQSEEVDSAGSPDLSKIQQFLVTLVLVGVYGAMVWSALVAGTVIDQGDVKGSLPALDQQFIWLLGISHASYLATKAVPQGGANASG